MQNDRWRKVKELFEAGLRKSAEERTAFLDDVCREDEELRAEVEALLNADGDDDAFLEPPTEASLMADSEDRLVGSHIGKYRLERLISRGGMGTVYEGLQTQPRRTVAVKIMRSGFASKSALRRFEFEAEILGHLRHPNIAQVIEAGTHGKDEAATLDGVPYFVMEYIPDARAITDYANVNELSITNRLKLFLQVCHAVHYGHQRGIIHRDLKPSNILVDAAGQVKIIDFGVARATDSDMALTTVQTDVGQLLGTVQYMSPEQCRADPSKLDIRSDVYALGVVLYELLCDELPYDVRRIAVFEATRMICEKEPKRPSTTHRALRGDIETILLTALEKDRSQRYQSVADFAADIDRYLRGETINAKPAGPATRTWKWIRRNPVVSITIGVASAVILIALLYVVLVAYPQVIAERNKAVDAMKEADFQREAAMKAMSDTEREAIRTRKVNEFLREMLSLPDPGQEGRDVKVAEALDRAVARIDEEFSDMPEIEASLRSTIGWTYFGLGRFEEAEKLLRRAVELGSEALGPAHLDTLDYKKNLSNVLRDRGRFKEAEALIREVYERRQKQLGAEDRLTLNAKSLLAEVLHRQSRWSEAEPLIREAFDDQVRILGEDHQDTVSSMDTFSGILVAQGKYEEAVALNRRAIEIRTRLYGASHAHTLGTLNNLGVTLVKMGHYAEAEELNRKILRGRRELLGEEHPLTISSMFNLANTLRRQGKYEEAERFFRKIVELRRRVLGEHHNETLRAMGSLALTLKDMGDAAGAEAILREALEGFRETLGEEHVDTLTTMDALAISLAVQGKSSEAKDLFFKGYEIRRRVFGAEHPATLSTMFNLASFLDQNDESADAEPLMRQVLDAYRRIKGNDHPSTASAMYCLGEIIKHQERFADAEPLYRESFEVRLRMDGVRNPNTFTSLHKWVSTVLDQDRYAEAEELLQEGLDLLAKTEPFNVERATAFYGTYGELCFRMERYAEAEGFLLQAMKCLEQFTTTDSPQTQWVINMLIDVYSAMGETEKLEAWRAKLQL